MEFLSARAVDYVSRDVANDGEARRRFEALAAPSLPVVATPGRWVPGVDLTQVAELLELPFEPAPALAPAVLIERLRLGLATAVSLAGQFPVANLGDRLPNRDRTTLALANHVVEIAAGYLQVEKGREFDVEVSTAIPRRELPPEALAERSRNLAAALRSPADATRQVQTFFGATTLHAVLERTAWHVAQHTRQLAALLKGLGIAPVAELADEDLAGLPLPAELWQ